MKSFRVFISEGGNIFKGKTGPIPREFIEPTLTVYFKELKRLFPKKSSIFNTRKFTGLGSVGKKELSGDLDLGIDLKTLLDKQMSDNSIESWGLDPVKIQAEYQVLKKRSRSATEESVMLRSFLLNLARYINNNSKLLYIDEKKITNNAMMFGLFPQFDASGKKQNLGVQVDWMIGNLKWLKFSYFSDAYPKESNIKGLHRTQLMLSAYHQVGLKFDHRNGLVDKETKKIITQDPKEALKELNKRLGLSISSKEADNYFDLHKRLKRLNSRKYGDIINSYLKILDSTRADIPSDLHDEWRSRRKKLGLKGKYLPDNSILKRELSDG